ncbi:unnamed protein product [Parnassius mnemosyne]|uniref:Craniofacial development protein 2 n=1 Tax=Parnassius mnemosyne TaxID=213953 RepID=A0AAV1KM97_9NEOP
MHTKFMGDMNAKIGYPEQNEQLVMGNFGYGTRNKRGEIFIHFCLQHRLKIANTTFNKPNGLRWTWKTPDGKSQNETDFIATNISKTLENFTVISKLHHPSDHRMVRITMSVQNNKESRVHYSKATTNTELNNTDEESPSLSDYDDDIQKINNKLKKTLIKCSTKNCTENKNEVIISQEIKEWKSENHILKNKKNKIKQEKES